jgi:hypothetical protein
MAKCNCNIAARINSTLAVKAMAELKKHDPAAVNRLQKETNEHAERLRKECPHGYSRAYPFSVNDVINAMVRKRPTVLRLHAVEGKQRR